MAGTTGTAAMQVCLLVLLPVLLSILLPVLLHVLLLNVLFILRWRSARCVYKDPWCEFRK